MQKLVFEKRKAIYLGKQGQLSSFSELREIQEKHYTN